jgi:hypothetical protein
LGSLAAQGWGGHKETSWPSYRWCVARRRALTGGCRTKVTRCGVGVGGDEHKLQNQGQKDRETLGFLLEEGIARWMARTLANWWWVAAVGWALLLVKWEWKREFSTGVDVFYSWREAGEVSHGVAGPDEPMPTTWSSETVAARRVAERSCVHTWATDMWGRGHLKQPGLTVALGRSISLN